MGKLVFGSLLFVLVGVSRADDKPRVEKQVYKKTAQVELAIHLHFPADWKATDKRPAIVFFFGGGWNAGSVGQFEKQADYLAQRGMVAARADYRVKSRHQVTPDSCVEDGKSAVRWLRSNAAKLGIDPDRLAAGGGSAGGHVAAATALVPGFEADGEDAKVSSKPNLLVLFNPVMNTTGLGDRMPGEMAKKLSPNAFMEKKTPPSIFFFGTKDRLLATAEEYMKKAKELGLDAELYTADDQAHGFFNRSPWMERTLHQADQFLTAHGYLKGEPTVKPAGEAALKKADTSPSKASK